MMYSVRKTTSYHGNSNLYVLIFILLLTTLLVVNFGKNYLTIFLSSGLLHVIIETGLTITGLRKGKTFLFGKKLHRVPEILLRSFVEGPAFCVPAFFVADQFSSGNASIAILASFLIVGGASGYLAHSDRRNIRMLPSKDSLIISRREMTNPKAIMLLALLNTICISIMFFIPTEHTEHASIYIFSYAGFVLLFYFINYNFGVRYIEMSDPVTNEYSKPNLVMQIAGLIYDSAYEMTILISPAYWIPLYLDFFK